MTIVLSNRQLANLNAIVPCVGLSTHAVTIDEKEEWDFAKTVREFFSSHIGEALAGKNIVHRAVQVMKLL